MNSSFSVIQNYGEDLTAKQYITDPSIARDVELKKMIMTLLTPEKSALLVGSAGVGKTSIVEGLAYRIINKNVPDALLDYKVIKLNSASLVGKISINNQETLIVNLLVQELSNSSKMIIFIDEIHTLIGDNETSMDLANILKPIIDRGVVKLIGATTDMEYNTYIIKDRAFLRRFERIDVFEPDEKTVVEILYRSLPKIESSTGIKFKYNDYVTKMLLESIVSATGPYKRVYGLGAMYPDIAFSVLTAAFSEALFKNEKLVKIEDVYNAIKNSKRIYPDSIIRELVAFKEKFKDLILQESINLPDVKIEDIKTDE